MTERIAKVTIVPRRLMPAPTTQPLETTPRYRLGDQTIQTRFRQESRPGGELSIIMMEADGIEIDSRLIGANTVSATRRVKGDKPVTLTPLVGEGFLVAANEEGTLTLIHLVGHELETREREILVPPGYSYCWAASTANLTVLERVEKTTFEENITRDSPHSQEMIAAASGCLISDTPRVRGAEVQELGEMEVRTRE